MHFLLEVKTMIVISGKEYDRVIEAHVVINGPCYLIYKDENFKEKKLSFKFGEIEVWNMRYRTYPKNK